jgi:hypothetical protein
VARWRIFYDDGSTYGSDDGPWADAPSDGVLYVLIQKADADVVETISGSDHYVLLDDETVATTGDLGPLLRLWGVKFGRWTTHRKMHEIGERVAREAASWPQ